MLRCSCLVPARIASGYGVCSCVAASSLRALLGWSIGKLPLRPLTRTVQGIELRYVPTALYVYHRGIRAIEAVEATYR